VDSYFFWIISAVLVLLGLVGTVLPVLPGVLLVWLGLLLGAWSEDFARVSVGTMVSITFLAVFASGLDFFAGMLGAKRAQASQLALVGAAVGTVVGIVMGLVGVLFMPLVGAALGEYWAQRNHQRAAKVALATWLGIMLGMIAKIVIAFMMLGIFLIALWV
jgi:uncharacterized protein YqgC (DUF456 family)